MTTDTSRACTFAPDPGCSLCAGLGKRHIARGMTTESVSCPCTLIGPPHVQAAMTCAASLGATQYTPAAVASYRRDLSELPPIQETPMHDPYPRCQPRTPIDPVGRVISPGLMRGNSDINPNAWNPPQYRDCDRCEGRGTGRALPGGGNAACTKCKGNGRVKL